MIDGDLLPVAVECSWRLAMYLYNYIEQLLLGMCTLKIELWIIKLIYFATL